MKRQACGFEDTLLLYCENMLEEKEKEDFEAHLAGCCQCQQDIALMKDFEARMGQEIPLPGDFNEKVRAKIEKAVPHNATAPAIGAAVVFLALFFLPGSSLSLPHVGMFLSTVATSLKGSHLWHIALEAFRQNGPVLISYMMLTAVTALASQVLLKKQVCTANERV